MNDAAFSPCGTYRYWLCRYLAAQPKSADGWTRILWVMLNPSTADCTVNDPTIKQCMAFSTLWGFDAMDVVNLYALRSTDPRGLDAVPEPVRIGRDNDTWTVKKAADANMIVCAWGANKHAPPRARYVVNDLLRPFMPLFCLGQTVKGMPWHPLYRPHDLQPKTWSMPV